jgi:hypothetical protein
MNQRLLRPRASGFDPRSISGLALWLDAADTQSLYTTDAGPVTPVSAPTEISGCVGWWDASDAASITQSGGLVSQWNDKSGLNNHATASGSARPTLTAGVLNGRSVMTFDGTANAMTVAANAAFNSNDLTYFVVFRQASPANKGIYTKLNADGTSLGFGLAARSPAAVWLLQKNAGLSQILTANVDPTTATRIYTVTSTTTATGFLDGLPYVAATGQTASHSLNQAVTLGARASSEYLNGFIAEIIHFNTALSTSGRARVEAYLAAKWGISGVHAQATATNDPVGYWRDKSGNGGIASQSTGSNRPTRGVINSRSSVTFTAANNTALRTTLNSTIGASKGPYTVVVIGNVTATANDKVLIGSIATGNFDTGVYANSSGGVAGLLVYTTGGILTNVSANSSPVGTPFVAALTKDSAIFEWWGNGARVERRSIGTTNNALSKLLESIGGSLNGSGVIDPARAYSGNVCEILAYQRALSGSQIIALSRYASQKWGAPFLSYPLVSNPDAQDWVNRVYQNGGTVSSTTASAVNQFCNDIDAAGIRDRFYRLNLFCGTADASLIAVRTPLYRGQSLGGTQFGNTLDTNVNFAITDYVETGASGGLKGDGSTKYLATGIGQTFAGTNEIHNSLGFTPNIAAGYQCAIGARYNVSNSVAAEVRGANANFRIAAFSGGLATSAYSPSSGRNSLLVNHSSANVFDVYSRGSLLQSLALGNYSAVTTANFLVFAGDTNGTPSAHFSGSADYYSIGLRFTSSTQVTAFHAAMATFRAALGRV